MREATHLKVATRSCPACHSAVPAAAGCCVRCGRRCAPRSGDVIALEYASGHGASARCNGCGYRSRPGARYCGVCGDPLAVSADSAVVIASDTGEPMAARIGRERVPIILQAEPAGCGIACLAMLLGVHGYQAHLAEIRADCDVGPDGATVLALATAARRRGFRATAFALGARDLRHLPLPVIAHWNADHFIVVERWLPEWVDVVDPANGRQRLTPEQFQRGFSGVALVCQPEPDRADETGGSDGFSDLMAADRGRTTVS